MGLGSMLKDEFLVLAGLATNAPGCIHLEFDGSYASSKIVCPADNMGVLHILQE